VEVHGDGKEGGRDEAGTPERLDTLPAGEVVQLPGAERTGGRDDRDEQPSTDVHHTERERDRDHPKAIRLVRLEAMGD